MPEIRIFLAVGAILSSIGLSACTSTGDSTATSFTLASSAHLALPDTVTVVPTSFAPNPDAPVAFAELAEPQLAATEAAFTPNAFAAKADTPNGEINGLIDKYAALYEVPVDLVRRVVKRESNFNPRYNRGHWGLMQIKHATARGMGYDGPARGLLDAETNLKYAVKYLRGAWMVADGNPDRRSPLPARLLLRRQAQGPARRDRLGRDRRVRKAPTI